MTKRTRWEKTEGAEICSMLLLRMSYMRRGWSTGRRYIMELHEGGCSMVRRNFMAGRCFMVGRR